MIRMQRSSAQPLSKLNIFLYFAWIHVQVQWNPRFSSWSLKACFFRGPEIEFLWNCGIIFKETVSFDDIEQSKDEENIVTYVDYVCGFNIYSEAPTEVDHINPERKIISRSCGKPNCFPTNDPKHQLFYRRRAYHYNLSEPIHPYTIWHKEEAALMTLNNTTDRDSTSNQYPQTTTHQSWRDLNPVFPSMWPMGSNRRESASALASFKKTTYWTDEWTRQLLPLKRKSWEIFGIPEQGMRFHGLWWTVVVFFNCSYLF